MKKSLCFLVLVWSTLAFAGSPIIWQGTNARLLPPGTLVDKTGTEFQKRGEELNLIEQASPTTPAANSLNIYAADTHGRETLQVQDSSGFVVELFRDNTLVGKNTTGGTLTKGTPVYINGGSGGFFTFAEADATDGTTMPAVGILAEDSADNAFSNILLVGQLEDFDTSAFTAGSVLYVSETAGTLTTTKPTHPALVQRIGLVLTSSVGSGAIEVNTREIDGSSQGSNVDTFSIGSDTGGGAVTTEFKNGSTGALSWTPTAARTLTLPDTTGSLFVSPTTTKGDVIVNNGTSDVRLPVGTNDYVLTADSAEASGVKWAVAAAAGADTTEVNYVLSPDSADDWDDSGASLVSSTTTTDIEIPTYPIKERALLLTSGGSAGTSSHCFQLGESHKNIRLKLKWSQRVSIDYTAGGLTYAIAADTNSTCTGTSTALKLVNSNATTGDVPAQNRIVSDAFDATDADYYKITFTWVDAVSNSYVTFNDITVGPGTTPTGAKVGDLEAFTSITSSGTGTSPTVRGTLRQVGEEMELDFSIKLGASPSGIITVTIPNGLNANTDLMRASPAGGTTSYWSIRGSSRYMDVSASPDAGYTGNPIVNNQTKTQIQFLSFDSGSAENLWGTSVNAPVTPAEGDVLHVYAMIPILEWAGKGTTTMLSDDVIYANARASASGNSQTIPTGAITTVVYDSEFYDQHDNYDTSTGEFTCPADGNYRVHGQARWSASTNAATTIVLYIYKNSSVVVGSNYAPSTTGFSMQVLSDVDCSAGDTLTVRVFQNTGGDVNLSSTASSSNRITVSRNSDFTAGDGVGISQATDEMPGFVSLQSYDSQASVAMTGGVSTGTTAAVVSAATGGVVTVSITITEGGGGDGAASDAEIAAGTIPSWARPAGSVYSTPCVVSFGGPTYFWARVLTDGGLLFTYRNISTGARQDWDTFVNSTPCIVSFPVNQ